jgi:hypothetical protein
MKRLTRKQIEARLADVQAVAEHNARFKATNTTEQATKDAVAVLSAQAINATRKQLVMLSVREERKRRKISRTMLTRRAA